MPADFIKAVVLVKWSAAQANASLGLLDAPYRDAIVQACGRLSMGEFADQFPVDRYQTGSGTSTNMNVNEVVAAIARQQGVDVKDRKSTRLNSSHVRISYAVFCLKKKKKIHT